MSRYLPHATTLIYILKPGGIEPEEEFLRLQERRKEEFRRTEGLIQVKKLTFFTFSTNVSSILEIGANKIFNLEMVKKLMMSIYKLITLDLTVLYGAFKGLNSWFRDIKDPEHPYSLEELKVVNEDAIEVNDGGSLVRVTFTPTVEHCSMATVIGLCIRVKLMRSLPSRYKVDVRVAPGTHATEAAVNKQLNDKERVAAALENPNLVEMVDECLAPSYS
ncbi:hypothetical protein H6P81_004585 [Aristolochia fimbriata]|uniref:MIP18 family-like domain-containing protein n=1 Tax=Aristolochia fimbriata TaxID=158543 RepID=A0AAV7EVN4_ARIFI|nr:hypothetical protein H6P81_004585 [Aristolochia fimbriata]